MANVIFIGLGGKVLAIDRDSGQEVWRTKLKGDFVNVVLQDGDLYAAAKGELFRLDPKTGNILWENQLKGLGTGLMTIATPGGQQIVLTREKRKRDDEAAASAAIG